MTASIETKRYQAYPEYKDSGIEWVGDIPSTWQVKPTFALFDPHADKNIDGLETNVLSLSYGRIIQRDVDKNFGLLPESFNTYQIVNSGDIILRLTDLQNDKRSLRVGLAKQRGIITSAYLKLVAKSELDPRFGYRLLHSYDTTKVFYGMGGGLRQSMKFEDFRRLPILLPSMQEQAQIANFLDHETAKIDTLIEKQQQLIKLLKEKRQAVISHAVTKGLNPQAPMKDSGVEWLGEVPEHWDVTSIKYQCALIDGDRGSNYPNENDYVESGIPFFSSKNIVNYKLTKKNLNYISKSKFASLGRGKLAHGDLIITVRGTIGHVAVFDSTNVGCDTGFINAQMMIIRPKKSLTDFLLYLSESDVWSHQLNLYSYGSTVKQLSNEVVGNFKFVLPHPDEMAPLLTYLKNIDSKYGELIGIAQKQIRLMQERRTALISAAVTGKIDVRNWQAPISQNQALEQTA
ncbi:TPA: restriction endonuclease subunit S [Vibrio fluvialis]|nr:restriction endonuclease subunit S [Vibrio fluvialis]